jgi:cysteinyl-tRNA synthetase
MNKGYSPLDYRYFLLMTHYRKKIRFSFDNLDAARNGFNNLKSKIKEVKSESKNAGDVSKNENVIKYKDRFTESINDDLNISEGLALTWDVLKDEALSSDEKIYLVEDFNKILGLELDKVEADSIPEEIINLANKRKEAKANKDFKLSDELRQQIKDLGYELLDKKGGEFDIKKL